MVVAGHGGRPADTRGQGATEIEWQSKWSGNGNSLPDIGGEGMPAPVSHVGTCTVSRQPPLPCRHVRKGDRRGIDRGGALFGASAFVAVAPEAMEVKAEALMEAQGGA